MRKKNGSGPKLSSTNSQRWKGESGILNFAAGILKIFTRCYFTTADWL